METKEHLFLMLLLLATYLPVAACGNIASNTSVRKVVLWVSALVVLLSLTMEGSGAIINASLKVGLMSVGQGGGL